MLLRIIASLCVVIHCTVPQRVAFCIAFTPNHGACCSREGSEGCAATPERCTEAESPCGGCSATARAASAAVSCCGQDAETSPPCAGETGPTAAEPEPAQPTRPADDCSDCAALCVCETGKPPIERSISPAQVLLDGLLASLAIATLDLPAAAPAAPPGADAVALAAFTAESPPERLARLSVWLN